MNMSNKLSTDPKAESHLSRESIMIGIFGALWGLMEVGLGGIIKGLRIPMGGAFLTALACIIFLTGRYFVRQPGSILMMGGIAAVLKVFSVGTVIAGPFMAILIEALLAEILISLLGIKKFSYLLTGAILTTYTIIHPFISQGIIFGDNIYKVYIETFKGLAALINIDITYFGIIILGYGGLHFLLGIAAGWIAFSISKKAEGEFYQYTQYGKKIE
jgi:hypothetical protein